MARNPLTPFGSGFGMVGGNDPFLSLHREMNRLFDDVLHGSGTSLRGGQDVAGSMVAPQLNVSETDKEIRVTAELPGVSENDIQVDLIEDTLVIRGEKKFERTDEKENFHFVEQSYDKFQRALHLPFSVSPDKVKADFENGVLTITLPKTAQQERTHHIQIHNGGRGKIGGNGETATRKAQGSSESPGGNEGKSGSGAKTG